MVVYCLRYCLIINGEPLSPIKGSSSPYTTTVREGAVVMPIAARVNGTNGGTGGMGYG